MAKTDLETLVVRLEAQINGFEKELRRANGVADRSARTIERRFAVMNDRISRLFRGGARLATQFGLAIGAVSAVRGIRNAISAVAELGDAAEAAGISAQALQVYRTVLDQNGSSADAADEAIQRFNQRLGDFAANGGAAAGAFRALDVSIRDASGNLRSTEDVLEEVWGKLGRVENASQLAALAADLFGTNAGPQMAQALREGAQGLQDTEDRLRRLGILMSDEMVQDAKDLDDQFDFLTQAIGTRFQQAVITAIGGAEDGGAAFDVFAGKVGDFFDLIANNIGLVERLVGLLIGLRFGGPIGGLIGAIAPDLIDAVNSIGETPDAWGGVVGLGNTPAHQPLEVEVNPPIVLTPPEPPGGGGGGGGGGGADRIQETIDALESERTQLGLTGEALAIYNALQRAGIDATNEHAAAVIAAATALYADQVASDAAADALDALNERMEKLKDTAKDLLSGFISDLREGKSAAEALGNVFDKLADKLIDMALDAAINSLFGNLGSAGAGTGGGGFIRSLFGGGAAGSGSAGSPPSLSVPDISRTVLSRLPSSAGARGPSSPSLAAAPVQIVVYSEPNPYMDLHVAQIGGRVADVKIGRAMRNAEQGQRRSG